MEAIVRVYNRWGRRDNMYKARIKILVKAEGARFTSEVQAEYKAIVEIDDGQSAHQLGIHMPNPSFFPLIASLGFPVIAMGLLYTFYLIPVGVMITVVGLYGWVLEPASD